MKFCSNCHKNFDDDPSFCPICGGKLDSITSSGEQCFCPKCGNQMSADTKFCPKCGGLNPKFSAMNNNIHNNPSSNSISKIEIIKQDYTSFTGRLNRKPFILRSILVSIILGILLCIVDAMFEDTLGLDEFGTLTTVQSTPEIILSCIFYLISAVINISLAVRRWHDLNKSGWFTLLYIIPFVNGIVMLYLIFAKGTSGSNKYGLDPLQ